MKCTMFGCSCLPAMHLGTQALSILCISIINMWLPRLLGKTIRRDAHRWAFYDLDLRVKHTYSMLQQLKLGLSICPSTREAGACSLAVPRRVKIQVR